MEKITDEMLVAYADGELTQQEHSVLQARISADQDLAKRAAVFLNTGREALSELYDPTLHAPVPDQLHASVLGDAPGSPSTAHVALQWWRRLRLRRPLETATAFAGGWQPAVALSLTLAVGGLAGWIGYQAMQTQPPVGPVAGAAQGGLLAALETQSTGRSLSISTSEHGERVLKVLLTFQSRTGEFCREYHVSDATAPSTVGVACRKPKGGWHIVVQAPVPRTNPTAGKVTTASHPKSPAVDAVVDDLIAGDVLTLEQEAAVIGRRWKGAP